MRAIFLFEGLWVCWVWGRFCLQLFPDMNSLADIIFGFSKWIMASPLYLWAWSCCNWSGVRW